MLIIHFFFVCKLPENLTFKIVLLVNISAIMFNLNAIYENVKLLLNDLEILYYGTFFLGTLNL